MKVSRLAALVWLAALAGWSPDSVGAADPSPPPAADPLAPLLAKPLHQFTESETGRYLDHLQAAEPDLRFLRARRAQS